MSLGDHYEDTGGSGAWLGAGTDIEVVVQSHEMITAKTGTPGVKFHLAAVGGKINHTFWLTEAAIGILAEFAKACGLSRERANQYDPLIATSHMVLHGSKCIIDVTKGPDDRFSEVVDFSWRPLHPDEPSAPPQQPAAPAQPAPPSGDDIPF